MGVPAWPSFKLKYVSVWNQLPAELSISKSLNPCPDAALFLTHDLYVHWG